MQQAIFKYPLSTIDLRPHPEAEGLSAVAIKVPAGAKILSVGVQHNQACVWAQVDVEPVNYEIRRFIMHGTELPLESADLAILEDCEFMGTMQLNGGHYVLHVFLESRP